MADTETEPAFAGAALQMTCINAQSDDPEKLAAWSRYYTEVHQPDLIRNNPGMERAYRFELVVPDPSGAFGPRFIAAYDWKSVHELRVFVVRGEDPNGSWRPDYLPQPPVWGSLGGGGGGGQQWGRLTSERIGESGPAQPAPTGALWEGMDVPAGASEAEINEFREFFANHHSLEIDAGLRYSRVTKWEIHDLGFNKPANGHPQFMAIYETDDATQAAIMTRSPVTQPISGPAVWDGRRMAWQHVYRRISNAVLPGARHTAELLS